MLGRGSPSIVWVGALLCAGVATWFGAPTTATSWAGRPQGASGRTVADCQECHAEIVSSWRASRHAVAATNPTFRASWEHWPNGWCLTCHAPDPAQQTALVGRPARPGVLEKVVDAPPAVDGVDCGTCHGRSGPIRVAGTPGAAAQAVHDLVEDPSLTDGSRCADCHEFRFQRHDVRGRIAYGDTLAQSTFTEWRAWQTETGDPRGCVDCHLGETHVLAGAHDAERVRRTVQIASIAGPDRDTFVLTAPDAGHAVPTGDPFRRIELWACATEACEDPVVLVKLRRTLSRTETSWADARDTRIPAGGAARVEVLHAEQSTGQTDRSLATRGPAHPHWRWVWRHGEARFESGLPPDEVGYALAAGRWPIP